MLRKAMRGYSTTRASELGQSDTAMGFYQTLCILARPTSSWYMTTSRYAFDTMPLHHCRGAKLCCAQSLKTRPESSMSDLSCATGRAFLAPPVPIELFGGFFTDL